MRIGKGGWWHEVKRPGGTQSPDQIAFQAQCGRANVTYLLGGTEAAMAHLAKLGVLASGVRQSRERRGG